MGTDATAGFVGRDAQFHVLAGAVTRLATGEGGVVVVTGPPGSGKTTLVDRALAGAEGLAVARLTVPGASARYGAAVLRPHPPPALPLVPWSHLPAHPGSGRPDDPAALAARTGPAQAEPAAGARAERATRAPRGLAVVVEGADRVAPGSWVALGDVAGAAAGVPLLIVLMGRDPAALGARVDGDAVWIHLSPLPDPAVAEIVTAAGVDDPATVRRLVRLAAGNPLVAGRVAAAVVAGTTRVDDEVATLLAQRIAAVDPLGVLPALALVDGPASAGLLAKAVDAAPSTVRRTLEAAVSAGFADRDRTSGHYRMAHPIAASTAVWAATHEAVQHLHLGISRAFSAQGGDPVEVARHAVAAGVRGDEAGRVCLEAALQAESRGRVEQAHEMAVHGLDAGVEATDLAIGLRRVLGRCLLWAGRPGEANDLLSDAAALAADVLDAVGAAEVVADLGLVDVLRTRVGQDRALLYEGSREAVAPGSDTHTRLTAALAVAVSAQAPERALALAAEAVDAVRQGADEVTGHLVSVACGRLAVRTRDGHLLSRLVELDGAIGGSGFGPSAVDVGHALGSGDRPALDYLLAPRRRPPGARVGLDERLLDVARLSRAVLDADEATIAALGPALVEPDGSIVPWLAAVALLPWGAATGSWVVGQPETLASTMPTTGAGRLFLTVVDGLRTEAGVAGRPARPGRGGLDGGPPADRSPESVEAPDLAGLARMLDVPDTFLDVAAAAAGLLGFRLRSRALASAAAAALAGHESEMVLLASVVTVGPAGWFAAWAHEELGDTPAALVANDLAADTCRRLRAELWSVACDLQRSVLLQHGDPAGSQAAAARAARRAQALRLEQVLVHTRVLLTPPPVVPAVSRPLLGARHEEVLQLAAGGLTNEQIARRLFLSVSTVERHLTHVYRALGVRNRAEAIAVAASPSPAPRLMR